MLKTDIDKYVELQELLLIRVREVADLLEIQKPNLLNEVKLEHYNIFIRGKFSFPANYLCESNDTINKIKAAIKQANEDRRLGIKRANAIEGYKENLELVELAKKELVELGIDPDTIRGDE